MIPVEIFVPMRRPLIVVLNRVDMASSASVAQWKKYLVTQGGLRADNRGGNVPVFFVDSKRGKGVHQVRFCDWAAGKGWPVASQGVKARRPRGERKVPRKVCSLEHSRRSTDAKICGEL